MALPEHPVLATVVARCTPAAPGTLPPATRWYLNGNDHGHLPFTLHPTEKANPLLGEDYCLISSSTFYTDTDILEITHCSIEEYDAEWQMQFTLRVESVSMVGQSRVYFSLHSQGKCLGRW